MNPIIKDILRLIISIPPVDDAEPDRLQPVRCLNTAGRKTLRGPQAKPANAEANGSAEREEGRLLRTMRVSEGERMSGKRPWRRRRAAGAVPTSTTSGRASVDDAIAGKAFGAVFSATLRRRSDPVARGRAP
jgi:hypothetical protein